MIKFIEDFIDYLIYEAGTRERLMILAVSIMIRYNCTVWAERMTGILRYICERR